jgi:hypothetical protein
MRRLLLPAAASSKRERSPLHTAAIACTDAALPAHPPSCRCGLLLLLAAAAATTTAAVAAAVVVVVAAAAAAASTGYRHVATCGC